VRCIARSHGHARHSSTAPQRSYSATILASFSICIPPTYQNDPGINIGLAARLQVNDTPAYIEAAVPPSLRTLSAASHSLLHFEALELGPQPLPAFLSACRTHPLLSLYRAARFSILEPGPLNLIALRRVWLQPEGLSKHHHPTSATCSPPLANV